MIEVLMYVSVPKNKFTAETPSELQNHVYFA